MSLQLSALCVPTLGSNKEKIIGKYRVVSKIGSGAFASVWKATHIETGEIVAIKAINRDKIRSRCNGPQQFESEIKIMMSMCHNNIVKLLGMHRSQRHIYLVIEYCERDLSSHMRFLGRPLTESEASRLLHDLISGLQFLHDHNLAHRDLKPQNLLLTENASTLKIADFGFAREIGSESMVETMCGSPLYMAPEILRSGSYDAKVADLWSVGVILFEMVTGRPPYSARNTVELVQKIDAADVQIPGSVSSSCRQLIRQVLNRDPGSRLLLSQIQSHAFLQSNPSLNDAVSAELPGNVFDMDDFQSVYVSVHSASNSDIRSLIELLTELAQGASNTPSIMLALYSKCMQIMVSLMDSRKQETEDHVEASFRFWMEHKIDQIGVQCRRVVASNRDMLFHSCQSSDISAEQYMYEKSLEMAREAAVGELTGDRPDKSLIQLRKVTILLQDVMQIVSTRGDVLVIQSLLRAFETRIASLLAKLSTHSR